MTIQRKPTIIAALFGVASVLAAAVWASRTVSAHKSKKALSEKLDTALEDSMDCSDPVARY